MSFRDQSHGLLLSELGDYMDGLGRGGGTKRLSTLIHHQGWKAQQIQEFLLRRADDQIGQWEAQGEDGLLIWDGTVLEKAESLTAEGLCAVRSSKAQRLTRIKKGDYYPPGKPIFVPGLHGIGLLVAGHSNRQGPAMLAMLHWWTSRGVWASYEKDENCKLLRLATHRWGRTLIHVFARGKAGLAPRTIFDAVRHCNVQGSVLFFPVTHPDYPDWPLTLVVGRRKGGQPWYLLTNEVVQTAADAWKVVFAYARRGPD